MSDDQTNDQKRIVWYNDNLKIAWKTITSSTNSFDQALLAVSSGALGVSVAFLKDVIPLQSAKCLSWLLASWLCFAICIIVTVFSFLLSVTANNARLRYLERALAEMNAADSLLPPPETEKVLFSYLIRACSWIGFATFLAGMIATIVFCWINAANFAAVTRRASWPMFHRM